MGEPSFPAVGNQQQENTMRKAFVAIACVFAFASVYGIEDEPDELNWDRLGGTVVGFTHFRQFCEENAKFAKRLMKEPKVDKLGKRVNTVWITADAFADAKIKQWDVQEHQGERCIVTGGAHNGNMVRIGVDIPKTGYYRIWAKYWHEFGNIASFNFALGDGRLAEMEDASLTFPHDEFFYRFDWSEHARRGNPLPDRKEEPTGWMWESTPLVRLEAGRYALTLSGNICGGPWSARIVNAIVFTQEPIAVPKKPEGGEAILTVAHKPSAEAVAFKEIWERRPVVCTGEVQASENLKRCWRAWRKAFFADLMDSRIQGAEAGRMAQMVYFDEMSNLLGTPAHVAAEKINIQNEFDKLTTDWGWRVKLEAEKFTITKEGWWVEGSGDASGGALLGTGYWGGEAEACCDYEVPENGIYNIWVRYVEIGGYLAKYVFFVEDQEGNVLHEEPLAADWAYNQSHGGLTWKKIRIPCPPDRKFRFRIYKSEGGSTYRRIDAVLLSNNDEYVPEGAADFFVPWDEEKEITVWRKPDPWSGYFRTQGPSPDDNLDPFEVPLREGEAETVLLLVRNNTDKTLDITPEIAGDRDGLVQWRVPALVSDSGGNWAPQPLLERDSYYAPARETVGVWLTIRGKKGFKKRTVKINIGSETCEMRITKKAPLASDTPVPYVYGWSCPYQLLSCWELYRELGVNCIGDMLIPKADAVKYGIRLTLHLNDAWMEDSHIKHVAERFRKQGYDCKDWVWSFMDEPGSEESIEAWIACAEKMKAVAPDVKLWVNPGEANKDSPDRVVKILKYVNAFCPYFNHWTFKGNNAEFNDYMERKGDHKFDIFMYYTTPCFGEKAPNAPWELLGIYGGAISCGLDGWAFFALQYGFEYSNSLWDEVNNYMGDQAVSIYRGAAFRTLSTRNSEAVREAVQRWRQAKYDQLHPKEAEE